MIRKMLGFVTVFLITLASTTQVYAATETNSSDGLSDVWIVVLISIFFLAFVFEMFSRGFGIVGLIGIVALGIFFYYQLVNDIADNQAVMFFVVGAILIAIELFIPGGIFGTIGLVGICVSFVLAVGDMSLALLAITIALVLSVALILVMTKVFGKKFLFYSAFVLKDANSTELGYVSTKSKTDLIGKSGKTLTTLRPAGTAIIDGERVDVVTEGDYIEHNKQVTVVFVEGVRVVVREVKKG